MKRKQKKTSHKHGKELSSQHTKKVRGGVVRGNVVGLGQDELGSESRLGKGFGKNAY